MFRQSLTIAALLTLCACGTATVQDTTDQPISGADVRAASRISKDPAEVVVAEPEPMPVVADSNCPTGKTETAPYVCVNSAPVVTLNRYVITDNYVVSGRTVTAPAGRSFLGVHASIRNMATERVYLNITVRTAGGDKVLGTLYGSTVVNQWLWSYIEPRDTTTGWVIFEVPAGTGLDSFATFDVIAHMDPQFIPVHADTQGVQQAYIPIQ